MKYKLMGQVNNDAADVAQFASDYTAVEIAYFRQLVRDSILQLYSLVVSKSNWAACHREDNNNSSDTP